MWHTPTYLGSIVPSTLNQVWNNQASEPSHRDVQIRYQLWATWLYPKAFSVNATNSRGHDRSAYHLGPAKGIPVFSAESDKQPFTTELSKPLNGHRASAPVPGCAPTWSGVTPRLVLLSNCCENAYRAPPGAYEIIFDELALRGHRQHHKTSTFVPVKLCLLHVSWMKKLRSYL